jgi:glycosyltransferase involved in cell wall biosynthesis
MASKIHKLAGDSSGQAPMPGGNDLHKDLKIVAGTEPNYVVSILIPCRNERGFIAKCLDSVLANDFPKDELEILIVDGMSEDGTREIVTEYMQRFPFIRLIDNPHRVTPYALNIGIAASRGEIVMRIDAHAVYSAEYVRSIVEALKLYDADNVGGIRRNVPRDNSLRGRTIAECMSHRFGVGGSRYRYVNLTAPETVDVVPYFCCRKEKLLELGGFNERLTRNQDMDFNNRLRRAGGKMLIVPGATCFYFQRTDWSSYLRRAFNDGIWAVFGFAHASHFPVWPRHLVPLAFVSAVMGSALASMFVPAARWILLVTLASYLVADLAASIDVARKARDVRCAFMALMAFAAFHSMYGLGSLWGCLKLVRMPAFWRKAAGLVEAKT